jgi:hypothetical protein
MIKPITDSSTDQLAVENVMNRIKTLKLAEGLIVLDASTDVIFSARVEGGAIVGYEFTDANGESVPATLLKKKQTRPGVPAADVCQICYTNRSDGREVCYKIPCPEQS